MIDTRLRTETLSPGRVRRRLYVRVAGETVGPLDVVPARVPELARGWVRTRQTVRVNRSGTWAVWSATDVRRGR